LRLIDEQIRRIEMKRHEAENRERQNDEEAGPS
jgi:hypothetical protein